MRSKTKTIWGCVCALILMTQIPAIAAPPAVESYTDLPIRGEPHLSPNGNDIAYIGNVKGQYFIIIHHLDGRPQTVLPTPNMEPTWVYWKNDNRLIFGVTYYSDSDRFRNSAQRAEDVFMQTRLFAIDADLKNFTDLFAPNRSGLVAPIGNTKPVFVDNLQDHVISFLPNDPDHILVLTRLDGVSKQEDLVKVDIHSGVFSPGGVRNANIVSVVADSTGLPRFVWRIESNRIVFEVRNGTDDDWHPIEKTQSLVGDGLLPVAFSAQDKHILYVTYAGGKADPGLYEFDLDAGALGRKLAVDAIPILRNDQLVGYTTQQGEDENTVYFDPQWSRDSQAIAKALPDKSVRIVDRTADGNRVLLRAGHGNQPNSYFLLDRSGAKPSLGLVLGDYAGIDDDQVVPVKLTSYQARDGLTIPALLTLPLGYKSGPIPFVVLPHDGPALHNDPHHFDPLVQLLASRGYGVLQSQFRGSSGHGSAFAKAGFRQWGGAMQDDVTDGTKWLIAQNYADPARIAIIGTGYGGYSALEGLVKNPGLYKCAAALAPITSLTAWRKTKSHQLFSEDYLPRLGDKDDELKANSPVNNVDKINVPVLLVHGKKDFTIPVSQSVELADAFKAAGKPITVIYLDQADHDFARQDDIRTWQSAVLGFLQQNLGQ